jgi:V/A-type H+-transporting ATPase subunit C
MSNVSAYGLVNVHIRTAIGELLSPEGWVKLSRGNDFLTFLQNLSDTAYGPIVNNIPPEHQTPRFFAYTIRKRIPEKFRIIEKASPLKARALINKIFQLHDLSNLKMVFRGIKAGDSWDKLKYLLTPTGYYPALPYDAMVNQGTIEGAVALISNTDYYRSLSNASVRYFMEDSLFPLEVLLDLDYWKRVWDEVQNLSGGDKKDASALIGQRLDINNLIWSSRYHVFHHLQEAEIINYTMGFAPKVNDEEIRQIANGVSISEIVEKVYPELQGKVDPTLAEADRLTRWEVELDRHFARCCQHFFVGNPFNLGPILAYLFLLEFEIRDLTLLSEAKALNLPKERYAPYLIRETLA